MLVDRIQKLRFQSSVRDYLGVSSIGDTCDRKLWRNKYQPIVEEYGYQQHDRFERGNWEEERILQHVKRCDFRVEATQMPLEVGSLKGHLDAIIRDLSDNSLYVLEIKTMMQKYFKDWVKRGVQETHHTYWVQCQCYMGMTGIDTAILIVRNIDNEELQEEIITFNDKVYKAHLEKAKRIDKAKIAPMGMTALKKKHYSCAWCKYEDECWGV